MSRVIASNFNALLDSADDPRKSIEQTLREMEDALKGAQREVVRSVAAEKQLRKKVEGLDIELDKWARRAELAVKHGDDDLAREALKQKKRATGERDRAEALRSQQRDNALELKAELSRMEGKIEELEARKGTLVTRAEQAKAGGGAEGLGAPAGGSAFAAFRRMEDQIEGVEAAYSAQREVDEALAPERGPGGMTREEVEARFRALEHGAEGISGTPADEVDEELEALKKKVRVQS